MSANWISLMNEWGQAKVPFLFIIDFEMEKPIVRRLPDVATEFRFNLNGFSNELPGHRKPIQLQFDPIAYERYATKFDVVMNGLLYGNSFLTNLTLSTPLSGTISLEEVFQSSQAKYRMWKKNDFVFFSPERFVKIGNRVISTNPMKGTIDASLPDAERIILNDQKETAEHITIVDLLRNDLSIVANHVEVKRFRYIDKIRTARGELLQVSSEIIGAVRKEFENRFGDIMHVLLPAGSVSGAPKQSTLQIIREAEGEKRGYYTGIAGYFDGTNFDSCVMIRFVEETKNGLRYRSGGGITTQSDALSEYKEAISKIYVPVA